MEKPIRVLHIVTHMNRGGLETMIMNYYRHIDRNKIQFDFLTHRSDKKDYDNEILSLGGKIYHLPPLNPFSLQYRKALKTFFKQHPEYQIVHCHLDCMSAIPLKYAKKSGIQNRIAHSHNTSQEKNIKYLIKLFYKNKITQYATKLLSCGDNAGNWMFNGAEFDVLNNAIDVQQFSYNVERRNNIRHELNIQDKLVFGHVGRFNEQKNHYFLIDIFNEINQLRSNSVLLLIGEGELRQQIYEKVTSLNLTDSVKFLGLRSDIHDLLNGMDCFLFPSLYEGLPVSIIEAQASGLLCIKSSNVTDECIVTDNVVSISLEMNAKEWAKVILNEIDSFERKNTSNDVINNGFDIVANTKKLESIYMEMVNND